MKINEVDMNEDAEKIEARVFIVERLSGRMKISVGADVEVTFSVISGKRENAGGGRNFREDFGRDLRFYRAVNGKKVLIATLTGVSDFYSIDDVNIYDWNPKLEVETSLKEDNNSSESNRKSKVTGGWQPHLTDDTGGEIPF